ncbi:pilus assembly FimT family protein [Deinococcus koreensis]|uniref:Type II secretion system protein GspH n=1 Tax=Deinococcus koreensis TaxID=2054903 RepID=A0A2K3UW72_9DEIO|nr:prepilin-type N-terminal cleavage/methylation domain-containing protein [Deinococcus koreensis]PNY80776.1 type II secretion system protein GspH [Deinococcus koreensis]
MRRPSRTAKRRAAGFTLLELLLVIAILGIVAGIFSWFLLRSLRQTELRDAGAQLVADLRRARSDAQKSGQVTTLQLDPLKTGYTVRVGAGTPAARELPHRVMVETETGPPQVLYQPPFGTLDDSGVVWRLRSLSYTDLQLYVKVVGITGKVMLSGAAD